MRGIERDFYFSRNWFRHETPIRRRRRGIMRTRDNQRKRLNRAQSLPAIEIAHRGAATRVSLWARAFQRLLDFRDCRGLFRAKPGRKPSLDDRAAYGLDAALAHCFDARVPYLRASDLRSRIAEHQLLQPLRRMHA